MKYNTMTVHCASLCLDVLNQGHFFRYTTPDILAFKSEVKMQIRVRLEPVSSAIPDEEGMIEALASGVMNVLLHYHYTAGRVSPDLIMELIQHRLDDFVKEWKARRDTQGMFG
ncbi:hypothetical protein L4F31_07110 [Vibrio paracholerae]|uniref:hypothetical protein n=1 Tax=Vibrio TaxID=662 RepID=UPI0015CF43BD|nr:hypothetical protein [Vibrio paracholerae]EKO3763976.1 hypothetical protein [Vibrio metschnikovii]MCO7023017.1 hypothetical protein [Vibrio paracholerae]GIA57921.1 hypothetical protein VCSRO181_0786 [Vibrio cholerae]